jgi:DNA-binding transcriptional MerR regulator
VHEAASGLGGASDVSEIPEKLFYKPGEVCKYTDTQPYVLRFWESEFPQLAPNRSRTGQRVYRREDLEMVLRIKKLLYEQEYTIADARRALDAEQRDAPPPSRVAEPVVEEEDHDPPVPPERTVERDDPAEPHDAGALEDRIAGLESRCARAEAERDALRDRCERVAGRLERLLAALPKGSGGEPQD